jgi:8-oxo-dGTP diphosphatase
MVLLEKLDEKQKDTSKRGAFYYRFDAAKYRKYLEEGFLFEV